ncbi:HlyD family secretion protein [Shewanella sedimentimangrovi]|uniref:Uncharacterized protein n=1 Tax=Shewanella sedimentimangrovi TaxID=2814293 RepID=A0ABX7R052_9GAMM|nr:hypothetical protein [Shewanella sedimentimangrovi]QSX36480.1 hypothetical protein JYB85_14475 [Shewanella sedimentimangrovi]
MKPLCIAVLLSLSPLGWAMGELPHMTEEQQQQILRFAVTQMRDKGGFDRLARCSGSSAAKMESLYSKVLRRCQVWDEREENAVEHCIIDAMSEGTGLTSEQLHACLPDDPEDIAADRVEALQHQVATLESQLNELMDNDHLNEAEENKLDTMEAQLEALRQELYQAEDELNRLQMTDAERAMDALYQSIGDAEPTAAQVEELKRLELQMLKERKQNMQDLMGQ